MSVSPADFELYSRVTGAPMPMSPQQQMQMAPQVYNFVRGRQYQPNRLGQAAKFLGKAALLGGAAYGAHELMKDRSIQPVNVKDVTDDDDNSGARPGFVPKTPKGGPSGGSGEEAADWDWSPVKKVEVVDDSVGNRRGGGVVNNSSIEVDTDPWDLPKYDRDKEDPRLAKRGTRADNAASPGGLRDRAEKFAQDVKLERFAPYTAIPLAGGIGLHQGMDAVKIMQGTPVQDIGTAWGMPIGQGDTELANRGLTSAVDHIPYVGHGAVEAVKGVGQGLARQGDAFHSLGNAISHTPFIGGWLSDTASAAAHLPPFEVMGNAFDAAGHAIQTGTPEIILGGLGVAGATAGIGAARAALQGQKDATATGNLLRAFKDRLTGKGLNLYEDHPQRADGPGQHRNVPSMTIQGEERRLPGGPAGLGAQVESQDIYLDGPRDQFYDATKYWRGGF